MKRSFRSLLLLAALLLPEVIFAENVKLDKATEVAEMFFVKNGAALTRSSSKLTLVNASEVAATRSGEASFYIFNRTGGGFVIVSALDAACPVLGYSLEGSFSMADDMPENLREWLDLYRQQIAERRKSGKPATAAELERWNDALEFAEGDGLPDAVDLQTADWNQGAPYNNLCPVDVNGKKSVAGCVPVAISEIVFFHKHPVKGTGTLSAFTSNGVDLPAVELGHEYQWNRMLSKYSSGNYTKEQGDAVAKLVFDIGMMIQASYSSNGTSGVTSRVIRLAQYMGYDKAMVKYSNTHKNDTEWKALLKDEIGSGYPVLFAADQAAGAGHAFVIDGYDASDRFLINWGWGGSSNGYYQLSAFGSYTINQIAYLNIRPDKGNDYTPNMLLITTTQGGVSYKGVEQAGGLVSPGQTFTVRFGGLSNAGYVTAEDIQIQFAHKSKDGTIKEWMRTSPLTKSSLGSGSYTWWTSNPELTVNKTIEEGDYCEPLYRLGSSGEWRQFYNANTVDDGVQVKMPLHIRDYTYLTYNKSKKTVGLCTFVGSTWTLKHADGTKIRSGKATTAEFKMNLSAYSGSYILEVACGEQSFSVNITL